MEQDQPIIVGYWISDKKRQKFKWCELEQLCLKEGLVLKAIDIESNLEAQGPIHVFFHKLTDILSKAEEGNKKAKTIIARLKNYIKNHPELIVIDPFEKVVNLRNRYKSYQMIQNGFRYDVNAFIPNFVEINTKCIPDIINSFEQNDIKFPCVCKPLIAQGSSNAHKMMVVFNKAGLIDCQPPFVAQNLVNHNAILYKVFIVNNRYHIVERPSLKNFYLEDCKLMSTIFFNSHDISKSGSNSKWTIISEEEQNLSVKPNKEIFERIVKKVGDVFGLVLVGVDVVIENLTEKYAIIDVNVFPGYDGYPHFFDHFVNSLKELLKNNKPIRQCSHPSLRKSVSDDLDSGFESDEKKKLPTF